MQVNFDLIIYSFNVTTSCRWILKVIVRFIGARWEAFFFRSCRAKWTHEATFVYALQSLCSSKVIYGIFAESFRLFLKIKKNCRKIIYYYSIIFMINVMSIFVCMQYLIEKFVCITRTFNSVTNCLFVRECNNYSQRCIKLILLCSNEANNDYGYFTLKVI